MNPVNRCVRSDRCQLTTRVQWREMSDVTAPRLVDALPAAASGRQGTNCIFQPGVSSMVTIGQRRHAWMDGIRRSLVHTVVAIGMIVGGAAAPASAQVFDPTFNATATGGVVFAVTPQPDGKVLIGGNFTTVNGVTKLRLARLNADGSLDTGFTTTITSGFEVRSIVVLANGKILIAGWFSEVAGVPRANIARLMSDGSVDPAFTASVTGGANQAYQLTRLLVQPDNKILVAGNIGQANGQGRFNLCRLNEDGTTDGAFAPGPNWHVYGLTLQNDGKILIAGAFEYVEGVQRSGFARLNPGGSLDTTFNPNFQNPFGPRPSVSAIRGDGKILVGGVFWIVNGVARASLALLNPDGTLDQTFDVPIFSGVNGTISGATGSVSAIKIQPDGKILIGGYFDHVGPIYSYFATRLLADGAYDYSFGLVLGDWGGQYVADLTLQPDGKVLIGGEFGLRNVGRLLADSPVPVNGDVRITGSATPEPVQPGGFLSYTFTLTNIGTHPSSAITFTNNLPANLQFNSCSPAQWCNGTGNAQTVSIPGLGVGQSVQVVIGATVTAGGGATIVNTASVAALSPDLTTSNNSVSVTSHTPVPPTADLQLTMGATPEPVENNGTLTYTITVSNIGTAAAATVQVVDTLPGGVTWLTCSAAGGACGGAGNARTISYSSIAAGAVRTITLTAKVIAGASATIVNTATVSTSSTDNVPGNNTASATSHTPASPPPADDTDDDTLPNEWESRFGLDPNSSTGDNGRGGDPDHDGRTNEQELAAGTHPRGFVTRFLAEGATNAFFRVRIALLNVGTQPARLLRRYLEPGGRAVPQFEVLEPGRRRTLTEADLTELTSPDFSTVIESDQPLVVDRTMSWGDGDYGSHAESGVPSPATTWYLAEGSTSGDFSLFYLIQNPNPDPTTATIRYLLPSGTPVIKTYPLPPLSRTTIPVDSEGAELANTDVSAVISAPLSIIVERAMYKSTATQPFAAGHGSAGVTAPSTHWFLAEGATGPFFDCFILLANPATQAANVTIDYLLSDGRTFSKTYRVGPESRFTIWVDDEQIPEGSESRPLDNVAVSSTITSDVPIIVERTMWWPSPAITSNFWTESHNSPGAIETGTKWALAEGEVGGSQAAETYILIANTSTFDSSARVTLYFEDGSSTEGTFFLTRRSRLNVNVSIDFPAAAGRRFGAVIESFGATPAQIVVERAMYTSPGGLTWTAGTNALAARMDGTQSAIGDGGAPSGRR
jgi:uncharacterized delta-60 repeat protein/uncharacterized repeat protein (TIGR01451 family)